MKTTHAILAVLFACLLVSAPSFAAEPAVKHHMEIKIATDDEMVSISADDLEIGESQQSFTDSGKEVLVTRTEDGFQLEVDGKEINVDVPGGDDHHTFMHMTDMHVTDDAHKKVVVRKFHGEGDESGFHFIHGDRDVMIERFSAADRLAESGVLDDLGEAKRQEILDTLRELEPHQIHKEVRVMVDDNQ